MLELALPSINSNFILSRIWSDPNRKHLSSIFITTIYWNIWRERNNKHTIILLSWLEHVFIELTLISPCGQVSYQIKRVCISADEEDYIQEISLGPKVGVARDGIEE